MWLLGECRGARLWSGDWGSGRGHGAREGGVSLGVGMRRSKGSRLSRMKLGKERALRMGEIEEVEQQCF